ncbi:hypothetical protein D3C79_695930 [compost metagenome]
MTIAIQALPVLTASIDVKARAHGHRIHVPTLFVGHAPVHAKAFTFQADIGFLVAHLGFAHAIKATLQVAMTDKETHPVNIAGAGFSNEQVRADLQALVVHFQTCWSRCPDFSRGWKERGPLTGDAVDVARRVALGHALGKCAQGAQAQAMSTDRCQCQPWHGLRLHLHQGVERVVILQAQRMGFQRGCQ